MDCKTARQDADGHKHYFKKLDQASRGINRLGEEKVSKREDARVSKCTKQLKQSYQVSLIIYIQYSIVCLRNYQIKLI